MNKTYRTYKTYQRKAKGFTLIELLVVITIIGVLAALITANLSDARARARDSRQKQAMSQLKTSLRLYYNDYQKYPEQSTFALCGSGKMNSVMGCGTNGDECCPKTGCAAEFSAGGGGCATVYMNKFPTGLGDNTVGYYKSGDNDDSFCLKTNLENASDADIITSAGACNAVCSPLIGRDLEAPEYAVCSD